ncbi:hypothetical protein DDW11_05865, partial [Sulfolobus sp. SCGC AB-777_G06]
MEKVDEHKQRHHYIALLEKVIENFILTLRVWGVPLSKVAGPGFEPGSQGP